MLVANVMTHYDGHLMIISEASRKTLFNSFASCDMSPDVFLCEVARIEVKSGFMILFVKDGEDDD